MSKYIYNLGACIERALSGAPQAQPALVAGYWANREFWLAEFAHLLTVIEGYDSRLNQMKIAYDQFVAKHGEHNRDEYGNPRHTVVEPVA